MSTLLELVPTGNDFDGKVAIVTGAASSMGAAAARLLPSRGAAVVVAAEILHRGGRTAAVATDLGDETQIEAMVAAFVDRFGSWNVLHNRGCLRDIPLIAVNRAGRRITQLVSQHEGCLALAAENPLPRMGGHV